MRKTKAEKYEQAKQKILAIGLQPKQYEAVLKVFAELLRF